MAKNYGFLGRLALLGTAIIWGTSFVILKSTLGSVSTLWLLSIRFSISAIILMAFAARRLKKMDRRTVKGAVLMGVCLALAYIVQTYGLVYTTAGKNAFLTATYCVLVPFLAWGIYKRKPGANNIIAAVLCITGIGFVSLSTGFDDINIGDVLTLFCGIFYAFQIIMMENYIDGGDSLAISAVEFSMAAVICVAGALIFEPFPSDIPHEAYFSLAYLSVMCTAVCFFLQAWGMRYTPASTAAVIMTLEAVFGAFLSIALGYEQLTPRLAIGFALIFAAVLMSEVGGQLFEKLKKQK